MLHAVNVPAMPDTKAKAAPTTPELMASSLALNPSRWLATLSPMVESTNLNDQMTAMASPAKTLQKTTRTRRDEDSTSSVTETGNGLTSIAIGFPPSADRGGIDLIREVAKGMSGITWSKCDVSPGGCDVVNRS